LKQFLRSKETGCIFNHSDELARNRDFEVVSEKEAFPEKFAPVDLKERPKQIDISVPKDAAIEPFVETPEMAKDVSRPIGRPGTRGPAKTGKASTPAVGLKGE